MKNLAVRLGFLSWQICCMMSQDLPLIYGKLSLANQALTPEELDTIASKCFKGIRLKTCTAFDDQNRDNKNNQISQSYCTAGNSNNENFVVDINDSIRDIHSRTHFTDDALRGDVFNPIVCTPFSTHHADQHCGEPVWCDHSKEMQRRLLSWQFPESNAEHSQIEQHQAYVLRRTPPSKDNNPSPPYSENINTHRFPLSKRSCANSKFLLFEPPSEDKGLGSMLHLTVGAFRFSLCLGRIFILVSNEEKKTLTKWKHTGCQGSTFECYFKPLSGCSLSTSDVTHAINVSDATYLHESPYAEEKVLRLTSYPKGSGICRMCGDPWTGDSTLFEGLHQGDSGYVFRDKKHADSAWQNLDPSTRHMLHFHAFKSSERLYWTSLFMRHIVRPRKWFQDTLKRTVALSLVTPLRTCNSSAPQTNFNSNYSNSSKPCNSYKTVAVVSAKHIPKPYLSLHVRYGTKFLETAPQPLYKYMDLIKKKYSFIRHIFISTETASVIESLVREYPEYNFFFLSYNRVEFLNLKETEKITPDADYVSELIFSFSNLFIAVDHADFFVGSLTSSWCAMMNVLQRTRGDGGSDYLSVDGGSAHTACF